MSMQPVFFDLQRATLGARERTGDKAIGVQVRAGTAEVVRVIYDKRGKATVTLLSGPHTPADAVKALEAMR